MQKLTSITEKFQKIEEAAKSREEQNLQFSKQAEQKLLTKMESNKENRINLLNALKEKLKKTVRPFRNSFFLQILIWIVSIIIIFALKNRTAKLHTSKS